MNNIDKTILNSRLGRYRSRHRLIVEKKEKPFTSPKTSEQVLNLTYLFDLGKQWNWNGSITNPFVVSSK